MPVVQSPETSIRIHSLPEPSEANSIDRLRKEEVRKIFNHLGEGESEIKDIRRLGLRDKDRKQPRNLLVKVACAFTVKNLLANARNLKTFSSPVFLSRALEPKEQLIEQQVLRKRRELILNKGVDTKELEVRDLKLLRNGVIVPLES